MCRSAQTHPLQALRSPISTTTCSDFLYNRDSLSRVSSTGRISTFMVRQFKWSAWISREVENLNFRPHRSNSHWISALLKVFDVERPNFLGAERS
ncbi:hypothetical protein AVEN_95622-1 [Araneus ventricosus]|uniref:Uncharacterized protein n=1 Tax=Araneus ventricosus TaxID=182803 RepID=A0A4Y2JQF9_ARAVE|nr:hypothetical protein AVEN_95622-1 [Araneus ventricosus]